MCLNISDEQLEKIQQEISKMGIPGSSCLSKEHLNIHQLLSKISIQEIQAKIDEFERIDLKTISDQDLADAISKVISVDVDGVQLSILHPRFYTYPAGTLFFRVRKLMEGDNSIPYSKTFSKEQDVWSPPSEYVTRPGRLNKIHESLLYTSPNTSLTAAKEMNIRENERFGLIVYKSRKPINVVLIGLWNDFPNYTTEENIKMKTYMDFLFKEFTLEVKVGSEYLYRVSEHITKFYFDLPPEQMDAWCYPSVKCKNHENVCFRPDHAKELLDVLGVRFCQMVEKEDGIELSCDCIAFFYGENRQLVFYPIKLKEDGQIDW